MCKEKIDVVLNIKNLVIFLLIAALEMTAFAGQGMIDNKFVPNASLNQTLAEECPYPAGSCIAYIYCSKQWPPLACTEIQIATDSCVVECGRLCSEKPIFCGQ